MDDEYRKKRNLPFKVSDRLPKEEKRKGRFFNKIKELLPFFKRKKTFESGLAGRIQSQLQQDAHLIVEKLKKLKDNLRKELDDKKESQLWNLFETVMNPLLRDYEKIEKQLTVGESNQEERSSAIKSYNDWFEKAKFWVALSSKPSDREGIVKAVVINTKHVSDISIDRDLKTLREYMTHEINVLGLDEPELVKVVSQIEAKLTPHIQALNSLKESRPNELKLEHLQEWKSQIDELRAKHFNAALHIIDDMLTPLFPPEEKEEEHEHLKEIFKLVAYLEEEVPVFLVEVEKMGSEDKEYKLLMHDHGIYLEEEVHRLNRDLRLTPELADRVHDLIQQMEQAMKSFP